MMARMATIEHEVKGHREAIILIATNKTLVMNVMVGDELVATVSLTDVEAGKLAEACKMVGLP